MPPFHDFLVCGISSQIQHAVPNFDELINSSDPDFSASGLKTSSVVRLGYLAVLPPSGFKGKIGSISPTRLNRLLKNLADYLRP